MQKKYIFLLFIPVLLVYILNLFVDVMDIDASQYAEMSREMLMSKNFLNVQTMGTDYLDKPPLLFWLSAFSYYLFGVGTVSYKLPSLLFALLAIYSTYRFARLYYSPQTALMAAFILATTEALFLITNDVRTDTILMGAVIFSIWQWSAYFENNKIFNLLAGSIGVGLALLAKGPIGFIAVAAALLPHIMLSKKWYLLFNIRLAISVVIIALMLTPMCIGLYQQWGVKGVKFYFWTQSFGRITGASDWSNNPDTFFLIHTTAWAFIPWSFFLFSGWADNLMIFYKKKLAVPEIISMSGFTLVFIALMLSQYQLPHYIFIVYPLGAVIAADYFVQLERRNIMMKILLTLQVLLLLCLVIVSYLFQYCLKGSDKVSLACILVLYPAVVLTVFYISRHRVYDNLNKRLSSFDLGAVNSPFLKGARGIWLLRLFTLSAGVIIVFNLLMAAFYFPAILKYQPGDDFGRYVRQHHSADSTYVTYMCGAGAAEIFYAQQAPVPVWDAALLNAMRRSKKHLLMVSAQNGIDQLNKDHVNYKVIAQRYHHNVARLSVDFLNPATRDSICDKVYLVAIDQ